MTIAPAGPVLSSTRSVATTPSEGRPRQRDGKGEHAIEVLRAERDHVHAMLSESRALERDAPLSRGRRVRREGGSGRRDLVRDELQWTESAVIWEESLASADQARIDRY